MNNRVWKIELQLEMKYGKNFKTYQLSIYVL